MKTTETEPDGDWFWRRDA